VDEAFELKYLMEHRGVKSDLYIYNQLIDACAPR
jgi:hypothetical protein